MNIHRQTAKNNKQTGVVLPIALIMLVAMTMLGLASVRGAATSEKLASNLQQKTISSEAAKSGIETVWDVTYLKSEIANYQIDQFDDPDPIDQAATKTGVVSDYDITTGKGSIDIDGNVTVQYCGEAEPIASDINANESAPALVGTLIDVTSTTQIENTKARTMVVQRAAMTSLKSGRSGACTTH